MATTNLEWTSTVSSSGVTTPDNVASSDDSRATGMAAGATMTFEITNAPGDYTDTNTGNQVRLSFEARVIGTVSRTKSVTITLVDSGGTPIQDSGASNITHTTQVNGSTDGTFNSATFTLANNYTATNINGWRLKLDVTEGGGMADSATVEIDYAAVVPLTYATAGTQYNQSCDATVAAVGGIVRGVSTKEAALVSATAALTRSTATTKAATATGTAVAATATTYVRTLAASVTAVPTLVRSISMTEAVTATCTAALVAQRTFIQVCAATVAAVADLATALIWGQACDAVVSATASISKQTGKAVSATATATASVTKNTGKILTGAVSAVANATPILVISQLCAAVVSAVADLATQYTAGDGTVTPFQIRRLFRRRMGWFFD